MKTQNKNKSTKMDFENKKYLTEIITKLRNVQKIEQPKNLHWKLCDTIIGILFSKEEININYDFNQGIYYVFPLINDFRIIFLMVLYAQLAFSLDDIVGNNFEGNLKIFYQRNH